MKRLLFHVACFLVTHFTLAQESAVKQINGVITAPGALAPLHFLAADELKGRGAIRPEIDIAARYISEQFRSYQLKQFKGTFDFYQTFDVKVVRPAKNGVVVLNNKTYKMGIDLLAPRSVSTAGISLDAPVTYVGKGTETELGKIDLKGKVVVMDIKPDDATPMRQALRTVSSRSKMAMDRGAVAIIGRYEDARDMSWGQMQQTLTREYLLQEQTVSQPIYFVYDADKSLVNSVQQVDRVTLRIDAHDIVTISARNVMGYVEGTDPKLKDEYIVVSAHYDHLGVAEEAKLLEGKRDSIYNGARDKAIGVAALINAAHYFTLHPPKRSLLFIAYTGEEMGHFGSKYFAANTPIPLKQIVFNLNIDNAGYNDTSRVSIIGLGRTSADADISKSSNAFGLVAMPDPAPEQNFFDRSDNESLASKGVPAPTFSLGMEKFDETITSHYHQLNDEVSSMNLDYALKYIKFIILAARNIADNPVQPQWKKGDKYEAPWKILYQKSIQ